MNLKTISLIVLTGILIGCGGSSGGSSGGGNGNGSNMARFLFDCDLNGLNGVLTLNVEVISTAGVVFGPGPNPDITGVIGTGEVLYLTSGTLESAVASYGFTGENNFADFFSNFTSERFLVEWLASENGLTMLINPFGQGPTTQECVLTSSMFL